MLHSCVCDYHKITFNLRHQCLHVIKASQPLPFRSLSHAHYKKKRGGGESGDEANRMLVQYNMECVVICPLRMRIMKQNGVAIATK